MMLINNLFSAAIFLGTTFCGAMRSDAENWPQFRGTRCDGIVSTPSPQAWGPSENIRWKIALPGEGWSSPIVWDDMVFVTAATLSDTSPARLSAGPEQYRGGGGRRRTDLTEAIFRWELICLDAMTGQVRWRRTAREGRPRIPRHSSNTYATETPVTDGQHVVAYFGMHGLYCYDTSGRLKWKKDLGSCEMRAGWGTASSPLLVENSVFLQVDNEEQSYLAAFDVSTGEEQWRAGREEPSQYSTPILWNNSVRRELIAGGQVCRSYDPGTGSLLWQLDMEKGRSSATPLAVNDMLFVGTEFRNRGGTDDGGGFLFAVRPGGSGDITPRGDETSSAHIAWKMARSGIQMASPAYCDGYLYLLERRRGVLHCVDARSGTTAYRKRIPGSRAFWASPWTANKRVFCLDDQGTTYVLAAGPEFQLLRSNDLDEQTWSTPAVAGGLLFLRTVDHLYCISADPVRSAGR